MQFPSFSSALDSEKAKENRQKNLNIKWGECFEHQTTDLTSSKSSRAHNCRQTILNKNHSWLWRVFCIPIIQVSHDRIDQDWETWKCYSRFSSKFKECNNQRNRDSTTSNTCNNTESHDKRKCQEATNFKSSRWKDFLVTTLPINLDPTDFIRILVTIFICFAFLNIEID